MRALLILTLAALAGCNQSRPSPLAHAAEYLWSQQGDDGGWHSHTYGLLRSGQSLTPFVLNALLAVPAEVYPLPKAKLERGLRFIRASTNQDGALGLNDPSLPDYPNYATALGLSVLCHARPAGWEQQAQRMIAGLRSQQFTEQNGWTPQHPAYGAWGMGGGRRTPPDTGHVDLAMSRYVIEALRDAGVPTTDPALRKARTFVERCQNLPDGGFFFSTTEFDTNKAGHDGKQFRSYGTTTADGIIALLALGAAQNEPRVAAAQRWLTGHHQDMNVPGFVGPAYDRWPQGLAFYYSAASTQALRSLNLNAARGVTDALLKVQAADGSWKNPEPLVKEDDPLIATAFAIRALLAEAGPSRSANAGR